MIKKVDLNKLPFDKQVEIGDGWTIEKTSMFIIEFCHNGEYVDMFFNYGAAEDFIEKISKNSNKVVEDKKILSDFFERNPNVLRRNGVLYRIVSHKSDGGDTIRDGDSVTYKKFVPVSYQFLKDYAKSFNVDYERLCKVLDV